MKNVVKSSKQPVKLQVKSVRGGVQVASQIRSGVTIKF
jgi:hypothetical protein